jgi:hypothetical protein
VLFVDHLSFDGFYTHVNDINKQNDVLWNIYPNPAQNKVIINGIASGQETVYVTMYDIAGKILRAKQSDPLETGNSFFITMDATNCSSGIYIIALQHDGITQFKKLVIE